MRSQPRDILTPLESLATAARMGLGVPLVVVALLPDEAGRVLGAFSAGPRTAGVFGQETSLSDTLARAVHRAQASLLIEDTRSHPLLRSTPVVRDVRVLACAAIPLRDREDRIIGALCAWDGVPRWWSEKDVGLLRHLAHGVEALLANAAVPSSATGRLPTREPAADVVLRALTDGLLLLDSDWSVQWANSRAAACLGVPVEMLRTIDARDALAAIVDATVFSAWQRALDSGSTTTFAWHHPPADRWFEGYAVPGERGLAIAVRDVSRARRAERARDERATQQRDAETLEAMALLAGGIAHDFNNLLTVIAANAELLQTTAVGEAGRVEIREIHRATSRATELTQQLLACGRQLALDPDVVVCNELLGAMEPAVHELLPESVRLESSLARSDTRVQVDPGLLRQVVLQLVRNAVDAMPSGGIVRLSTEVIALEEPLPARPKSVDAGMWVVLTVEDTGHGIAPAVIDRVFEPFFTTRDVGAGIGLGLATAYGIVGQSGGHCTVESVFGRGTTIRVWLPALAPAPRTTSL
jgi:signal transduction histidine kinase